jgi:hypothetical protein
VTRRIVYTRHDGGVSICQPSPWCVEWLANGGFWAWRPQESLEALVESGVAQGRHEWAVRRFIRAMNDGGCTTAEAFAIIRDRDCGHLGTGFEVWDIADLPDRWFRDAWVRSHNGGPINTDLGLARRIQFKRIKAALTHENKRRADDLELFDQPLELPLRTIRDQLYKTDDLTILRRTWPRELMKGAQPNGRG